METACLTNLLRIPQELLVLADSRFSAEVPVHQQSFDWLQPGGLKALRSASGVQKVAVEITCLLCARPTSACRGGVKAIEIRVIV